MRLIPVIISILISLALSTAQGEPLNSQQEYLEVLQELDKLGPLCENITLEDKTNYNIYNLQMNATNMEFNDLETPVAQPQDEKDLYLSIQNCRDLYAFVGIFWKLACDLYDEQNPDASNDILEEIEEFISDAELALVLAWDNYNSFDFESDSDGNGGSGGGGGGGGGCFINSNTTP